MTILQQYGVYAGGVLSKQPALGRSILISPYFLNLYEGNVSGSGDVNHTGITKAVELSFGVTASPTIYRTPLNPPIYKIFVGLPAGKVWIYYDEPHSDIGLSTTLPTGSVIFGAISWPANNGSVVTDNASIYYTQPMSMSTVDIDLTDRTEALVAKSTGGLEATKLYYDSQRYIAGQLNKPLADSAVISEVLLAESSLRAGGNFFITLLQDSEITTDPTNLYSLTNLSVLLSPCKHIARVINDFTTFNTKAVPGSAYALVKTYASAATFQNKYIYVMVHKQTGIPAITEESSIAFSSSTHYIIAKTDAPVGGAATDLTGVTFQVVNDIISLTRVQQEQAIIPRAEHPTGWLNPIKIDEVGGLDNTIHLNAETVSIDGFGVEISNQNITLPPPPVSGSAFDVVWLETEFVADPVLRVSSVIRVTRTLDPGIISLDHAMLHSSITNNAAAPVGFIRQAGNLFVASKPENDYDARTYALPIAIVSRYNTGVFGVANGNGGLNRPDNKTALIIKTPEILINAPTINRRTPKELVGKHGQFLLKGDLPVKLEEAIYGSGSTGHYSTKPLQVDFLGTNALGTSIGLPNGGRRLWGHNLAKPDTMTFLCQSNVDFSGYVGVFNSAGGHKLTIKVPAGTTDTEIVLDVVTGQPRDISVVWASDGTNVKTLGNWAVGPLNEVADIFLDTGDPSFASHDPGAILVSFKVKYTTRLGFSHLPADMVSASINDSAAFASKYWLSSKQAVNGKKQGELGPDVVVGSDLWKRQLWETALGSVFKFYAVQMRVPFNGNNLSNTAYIIPDTYVDGSDTYQFNGVSAVLDKNGQVLAVRECKWDSANNRFEVKLISVVPSGDVVWFCMGVVGKELDYDTGSAEVSDLTEAKMINPILAPASGIIFYSSGNLIYGMESLNNVSSVYLEDYAVPVALTGMGTNLLKIDMHISAAQYAGLPVAAQANYVVAGLGYRPITGTVVKFGILESRNETQNIVVKYHYNSTPFVPFSTASHAEVVDRGFLIQTTDGSGVFTNNPFGPLDIILPAVQGVLVTGNGVTNPSPLGMNDVFQYQQFNNPFLEGAEIVFDGTLALNVNTHQNEGLSAWICLIEQDGRLLLFVYEVRDGLFVLNNPNQAFVCELKDFRRVK